VQIEEIVKEHDVNERLIEWLQDDLSETESDILAHSKKKGELSKRKLKVSPQLKRKNMHKKLLAQIRRIVRAKSPTNPQHRKIRLENIVQGLI
jgi:predicted HTH transcriptional regulator